MLVKKYNWHINGLDSYIIKEERTIFDYPRYLGDLRTGVKGLNAYLDHFNIAIDELDHGRAVFRMPIRPEYLQGANTMQGGLIVALADEAIAHAMMTRLSPDEGLTTIELKSNFLSGVSEGELIANASVFKKGRSLMIGDALVTCSAGNPICRVSATFMVLSKSKS